ncbi:MAG: sulfotransferase domain-containing protein [Myxococcales bacterium]|nr:sulfotransferase domain-containing protein [Myxococcales bacterium]
MPHTLHNKPEAIERVLIVDGVSRSGKKLLCQLLATLEHVEPFIYASIIEKLGYLAQLELLDADVAAKLAALYGDELAYNRAVGRDLNTRRGDASSVLDSPRADELLARRELAEGDAAIQRFNEASGVALLMTHALLPAMPPLLAAWPAPRVIHIARDPLHVACSWLERGWGERIGRDPRAFALTLRGPDGEALPWFAAPYAAEYAAMSAAERCVRAVCDLTAASLDSLATLRGDDRVMSLRFESLLRAPRPTMARAAAFVGSRADEAALEALLARSALPAELPDSSQREAAIATLERSVSETTMIRLRALCERYAAEAA